MYYDNYQTLTVVQYSKRYKKWIEKKPNSNHAIHPKGIIGVCTYDQISISVPHNLSRGIPLHRIVYVWFNDIIEPYNEYNEKMEICHKDGNSHNNHLSNLVWDTAKNNRAMRKGARNQHDTPRLKQYESIK